MTVVDRSAPGFLISVVTGTGRQQRVTDQTHRVVNFTYTDSEKKADKVVLEVENFDLSNFDDQLWRKGHVVRAAWGYPGRIGPIRDCVIKKVTGFTTLHIEAHGKSVLLDQEVRTRTFRDKSVEEVVTEIAEEWGYGEDARFIQQSKSKRRFVTQARLTDAQFLRRLAHQEGYQFFIDFDGLHFHERQLGQKPIREFIYYTDPRQGDIINIHIEDDVSKKSAQVTVKGRDPATKKPIIAVANNLSDSDRETLNPNVPSGLELPTNAGQAWDAALLQQEYDRQRERAEALGFPAQAALGDVTTQSVGPAWEAALGLDSWRRTLPTQERAEALGFTASPVPANFVPGNVTIEHINDDQTTTKVHASVEIVPSANSVEQAQVEAKKRFREAMRAAIKMKVTAVGDPYMLAKTVVQVRGIGKRLSGKYYVSEVTHRLGEQYTIELKLLSDSEGILAKGPTKPPEPQNAKVNEQTVFRGENINDDQTTTQFAVILAPADRTPNLGPYLGPATASNVSGWDPALASFDLTRPPGKLTNDALVKKLRDSLDPSK